MFFVKSTLGALVLIGITSPGLAQDSQGALPVRPVQSLVSRGSEKPSFDCATAKTAAAHLICADGELARLDGEVASAFQKRKTQISPSDQSKFNSGQLTWIRDRNARCELNGKNDAPIEALADSKQCMVSAFRERIAFLGQTESVTGPSKTRPVRAPRDASAVADPLDLRPTQKTEMPPIAAVVGSSPETRRLICTGPDALAYLRNKLRDIRGSDLELQDVVAVDSRTCRATVVENGKRMPGTIKLERVSGYERIDWSGGISWPTGVRFNEPPDDPLEGIRKQAEKEPHKIILCQARVHVTLAACYAIMKLIGNGVEFYAANAFLQQCGAMRTAVCQTLAEELWMLSEKAKSKSKYDLAEECAVDLENKLVGGEKTQYLNACTDLVRVLR
jgi:uncharacterized protein